MHFDVVYLPLVITTNGSHDVTEQKETHNIFDETTQIGQNIKQ